MAATVKTYQDMFNFIIDYIRFLGETYGETWIEIRDGLEFATDPRWIATPNLCCSSDKLKHGYQ